jgi:hypothetical protein
MVIEDDYFGFSNEKTAEDSDEIKVQAEEM